jgi:selenium-dependent molybdenum hydroxylase system protein, YqeB family
VIDRIGGLVVVRGAGDLATGTIARLLRSGFAVIALEAEKPTAIRRTVALSEAVYEGEAQVAGIVGLKVASTDEALRIAREGGGRVPILVDPDGLVIEALEPMALVDAIIAKRNLGTRRSMARIVVALGPGFEAPADAHAVVETNRGHDLGRVIYEGAAEPNTGTPGIIGGRGAERVVHAPAAGLIETLCEIGDAVRAGQQIAAIRDAETGTRTIVESPLDGTLRGLIRPGLSVPAGLKIADVDPRGVRAHCYSVSDKARAIAGGVLEAILALGGRPA